jgi:hypothetical protein
MLVLRQQKPVIHTDVMYAGFAGAKTSAKMLTVCNN